MKLYHGTYFNERPEIKRGAYALGASDNVFDGIFASSEEDVAESHGEYIFVFEVDEDLIATSNDLDNEKSLAVLAEETNIDDKDRLYELLDAVCYKSNLSEFDLENELNRRSEFDLDGGWELQRLRGCIAFNLGFKAVECEDEHGTSYLIVKE